MCTRGKCRYCNSDAALYNQGNSKQIECPVCGNVIYNDFGIYSGEDMLDEIAAYLYYNNNPKMTGKSEECFTRIYNAEKETPQGYGIEAQLVSLEEIKAFIPQTFSERVDKILLGFAKRSSYIGEVVDFTKDELDSALFIQRYDKNGKLLSAIPQNIQRDVILEYINEEMRYVECGSAGLDAYRILLKPEGLKRIDTLQRDSNATSQTVFVAMSFSDAMQEAREAIKEAIASCGFMPRIMDEIQHNHQIVPEMLCEIRESKFVIAELTEHNNGAYFEAGYALGKEKEVIQICKESDFAEDGHFDVKQINTILWHDTDDLKEKLKARIKATIG